MSIPSGLGSQLGISIHEPSYGTYKVPSRFYEFNNEAMNLSRAFLMSQGIRANRLYQSSTRRVATTKSAAGTVNMEIPTEGFDSFLELLHGKSYAPVKIGAGLAYKEKHEIGTTDAFEKSVTMQIGKPLTTGTVTPYNYKGTILTSLAISCQTGGFAEATLTCDARDEDVVEALASATYPTGLGGFDFTDAAIEFNASPVEEARGFTLTLNAPKDTGRFYLGAELKAKPLTNAFQAGTGTMTFDYGSKTLYEVFSKGEIKAARFKLLNTTAISEANKSTIDIKLAAVGLDGDTPNVSGPGILQQSINFVILDNGSVPPVEIETISLQKEL